MNHYADLDPSELVVLEVDRDRLPILVEDLGHGPYPHCFAELTPTDVLRTHDLRRRCSKNRRRVKDLSKAGEGDALRHASRRLDHSASRPAAQPKGSSTIGSRRSAVGHLTSRDGVPTPQPRRRPSTGFAGGFGWPSHAARFQRRLQQPRASRRRLLAALPLAACTSQPTAAASGSAGGAEVRTVRRRIVDSRAAKGSNTTNEVLQVAANDSTHDACAWGPRLPSWGFRSNPKDRRSSTRRCKRRFSTRIRRRPDAIMIAPPT